MAHLASIAALFKRSDGTELLPDVVPPEGTRWLSVHAAHFIFDEFGTFLGVYSDTTGRFNPLAECRS